jgi:hypothetical protein
MPAVRNTQVCGMDRVNADVLLLPCSFVDCEVMFRSTGARTKHIRTVHASDLEPSSDLVDVEISPPHTPLPAPSDRFQLLCPHPECSRSFRSKPGLTKHMRTHHSRPLQVIRPSIPATDRQPLFDFPQLEPLSTPVRGRGQIEEHRPDSVSPGNLELPQQPSGRRTPQNDAYVASSPTLPHSSGGPRLWPIDNFDQSSMDHDPPFDLFDDLMDYGTAEDGAHRMQHDDGPSGPVTRTYHPLLDGEKFTT